MSVLVSVSQVVLGEPRNDMNPLLMKPPLGRPLTRCYTAPYNANETFGKCYNFHDGGVPAALNHFNMAVVKPYKNLLVKDFIILNKQAATAGLVRAEEQQAYRASHEVLKDKSAKTRVLKPAKKLSPDFMTFGVPTRPSTPVYDLLENSYQERWIRNMRDSELAKREQEKRAKRSKDIQDTRTSLMRKKVVRMEQEKLWQMPKWGKVKPFLNTFSSEKEKLRALRRPKSA